MKTQGEDVNNSRYQKLAGVWLLLSQLLFVSTTVRAEELRYEPALPEPLQGMVSAKVAAPQSHLLFGNVQQKSSLPQQSNASETRLLSQSAKMAPPIDQLHKLNALQNYTGDTQSQTWFKIPPWLAGTWKIQDRQLIGEVNYRTGKQTPWRQLTFGYCGEKYGLQQDKNGTFWQFEKLGTEPSNYHVDKNGLAHFNVVESNQPIFSSDTQLVLKKTWSNVVMNPDTKQTIDVKHLESTLTFKRISDDSIEIADATAVFDRQGAAISRKWVQTTKVKVAPFEPVDHLHGTDVRALFAAYTK